MLVAAIAAVTIVMGAVVLGGKPTSLRARIGGPFPDSEGTSCGWVEVCSSFCPVKLSMPAHGLLGTHLKAVLPTLLLI